MKSYYKILGIKYNSSNKDITDSFIKLANKKDKDLSELSEAYEILIDPVKRHEYDKNYHIKMNINFTEPEIVYNSVIKPSKKKSRYFVNKQHIYNDFGKNDDVTSSHVLCKFNW
tara:strand:+ start:812 stop:1153 length:342 start_codon:yes stop_codon:yes gene_type:complete